MNGSRGFPRGKTRASRDPEPALPPTRYPRPSTRPEIACTKTACSCCNACTSCPNTARSQSFCCSQRASTACRSTILECRYIAAHPTLMAYLDTAVCLAAYTHSEHFCLAALQFQPPVRGKRQRKRQRSKRSIIQWREHQRRKRRQILRSTPSGRKGDP